MNYQRELEKIIDGLQGAEGISAPSLFLHSCCAPCSSYVLEYLRRYFRITVFYFNPNISDVSEYQKRVEEQKRLIARRDSLLEAGTQMRILNRQNEELLQQALEMVEFDLTLLRSMRQAPETANYDKNAYNTGELLGGSAFDARQ